MLQALNIDSVFIYLNKFIYYTIFGFIILAIGGIIWALYLKHTQSIKSGAMVSRIVVNCIILGLTIAISIFFDIKFV